MDSAGTVMVIAMAFTECVHTWYWEAHVVPQNLLLVYSSPEQY
jgi:hypothetical protein